LREFDQLRGPGVAGFQVDAAPSPIPALGDVADFVAVAVELGLAVAVGGEAAVKLGKNFDDAVHDVAIAVAADALEGAAGFNA